MQLKHYARSIVKKIKEKTVRIEYNWISLEFSLLIKLSEDSRILMVHNLVIVGFVVTHTVKIVVLETQDIGVLLDGLLGLGIYQI